MGTAATKVCVYRISSNSVASPRLLSRRAQQELHKGSCCCFWCSCPSPASMNQARKEMNSCQSDLNQLWENKLGVPLKKIFKKILLPFESLWGHWEHAFKLFCSALRDGKLLLIQENKALHCHYQQKKKSWNAYEHFAPGAVAVRKNHCNHHKTWQHQGRASRVLFPITVNHRLSPVCCETSNCGSLNTINKTTVPRCTWLAFVEARGKFTLLPRVWTEASWCFYVAQWGQFTKRSCK